MSNLSEPAPPPAISIRGLSVSYDLKRVLTNIYLDLAPGHLYGIIGPNGAGKSTLFKSILDLIDVNSGKVLIHGAPIEQMRRRVTYVPQRDDIDWTFPATVMDVVLIGRYPYRGILQRFTKTDHQIAADALDQLGIAHLRERQIGQLSGGQQQRVFLARALCQQADIVLLDEPFVGVDITTEQRIIQILKQLAAEGKTLLVVHHDLDSVREYFDRVIMLNQRLVAEGDTDTTFTEENLRATYTSQLDILHKTGLL